MMLESGFSDAVEGLLVESANDKNKNVQARCKGSEHEQAYS